MPSKKIDKRYKETLDYIFNLRGSKDIQGLERITKALEGLGNPQDDFKTVHVAGTNGKGSVSSMIASVLKESGFNVGLYTSPYLVDFRERIQVNAKMITRSSIVKLAEEVKEHESEMTYFEFLTTMAFLYFRKKKVDYAVIEVGLGGRLDATNVITPEISVITNVSNDHEDVLGHGAGNIAYEKAGIIKPAVPVVTAASGEAFVSLWDRAKEMGSRIIKVEDKAIRLDMDESGQKIEIDGRKMSLPLLGDFQLENSAVAFRTLEEMKKIEKNITYKSIKAGFENVKFPGRMQIISKKPMIILDGAHNMAGVKSLCSSIKKMDKGKVISVIGIKRDKDHEAILKELEKISSFMIFSKSDVKPADPIDLFSLVKKNGLVMEDIKKAVGIAKYMCREDENDIILITGSLYFIGNVMEKMNVK